MNFRYMCAFLCERLVWRESPNESVWLDNESYEWLTVIGGVLYNILALKAD